MNPSVVEKCALVVAGAYIAYTALRLMRAYVYDTLIVGLTTEWYAQVLKRLPDKSKLLDVGIGTGAALVANKELLLSKNIRVDGVDYDLDYVKRCHELLRAHKLCERVHVHHASIYDFYGGQYDAVYFSSSLMIMPDAVQSLKHTVSQLKPNGLVYVTQTIQTKRSAVVEIGKPLLKYLTTIDFGNVTYEDDLLTTFKRAGLTVLENVPISGSTYNSTRSFRLFVLKP